ncbi:MAG: glutamyl-tRNA amidotransferase [Nitrospirae bacterium RBG_19FT_COMBO_42_15]|nr:MAG: glutamyl-tRNA amidotransferase [Nitrospirae bacterium RBG_19FT_COMBO_42_15]
MSLQEQLVNDMKESMKSGDSVKVSTIRMLKAAIKNKEIEKGGTSYKLSDKETLEVIATAIKQRRDSIEQFTKGNRQDLAEKEKKELDILQAYMPPQMSDEDVKAEVKKAITETSASSQKDMGKVMKVLMPRIAGRADGTVVNRIVRELIGN